MKKILSVLCALAFIASFACIGASAADPAVTVSLVPGETVVGSTQATVEIIATVPTGGDVTQFGLLIDYADELTLAECAQGNAGGMFQTSQTVDVKPYMVLFILGTSSLKAGDNLIATLTFDLPADAAEGATYDVTVTCEPDNYPAATTGTVYTDDQIVLNNATIEVIVPVVTTTSTVTETETETETETAPVESESESAAPVESESETATESETEKPDDNKSSQTGDMMFVVIAVMVVALGAAVVVKKVNVK